MHGRKNIKFQKTSIAGHNDNFKYHILFHDPVNSLDSTL